MTSVAPPPPDGRHPSGPSRLAYSDAMNSVGTVAAPLLAGFALASITGILTAAEHFRWAGLAALILTAAAVLLVAALECNLNARTYAWPLHTEPAPLVAWAAEPEPSPGDPDDPVYRAAVLARWTTWTRWTRLLYNAGIVALFASLSCALVPPAHDPTAGYRWVAAVLVLVACLVEIGWAVRAPSPLR